MELPELKMKYRELGSFEFTALMQKIANTPTQSSKAAHIRDTIKAVMEAKDKISESYKAISSEYGEKDEKGELIKDQDGAYGFKVLPEKEEAFSKAIMEFDKMESTIVCRPLTPDALSDIRLSAKEVELLGALFVSQNGPGVPQGNLIPMK